MTEIQRLQTEAIRWSAKQFGANRGVKGPIAHLIKELKELEENPVDILEHADVLLLVLDIMSQAHKDVDTVIDAAFFKLDINRNREWGEPDEDGCVEHVRGKNVEDR